MTIFGLTLSEIGIQLLGFVAMAFGIGSFQAKKRVYILLMQSIASLLWVTQFLLLGGFTGAALNFIAVLRGATYMQKGKYKWASGIWMPIIFSVLLIVMGIFTWEGFISLLPTGAMVVSSFALFMTDERKIRYLSLIVSPPWLVYDIITGTIAGTLAEVFSLTSIIIAIYRFRKKD